MALSPADFYAYSRATGTPYPEDPEERARVAPEVLQFRRNQLKAPTQEEDQGFNLTNALGVGAALAGIAGGAFGLNRVFAARGRDARTVTPEPLQTETVERGQRAAEEVATGDFGAVGSLVRDLPPPSKQVSSVKLPDPWSTQETPVATQPVQQTSEQPKKFSPRGYLESSGAIAPAENLTEIQQNQKSFVQQQSAEAVDTGLDQVVNSEVTIPEQRQVNGFKVFSQQAEQISTEASAQRAAQFAAQQALLAQKSKAPKNARMLQALGPKNGLTQEEIFHRISASASDYKPGSMQPLTQLDVAALLDPSVPTENVQDLLGTTLAVRGGRVGRNLDYEVMAEGGGMTERANDVDIVGEFGSDVYAYNPTTGQYEINTTADLEDLNLNRGRGTDYENNAADYGDVEGPGGFVLSKGFKERTKSGTTTVPGKVSESQGMAPGSLRQEREIDRVLPARETLEGDPAAGWILDPQTGKLRFIGAGTRLQETRTNVAGKPIRVVDTTTGRVRPLGAYQGQITVDDPSYDSTSGGKLTGRYQPATAEPSTEINTAPITEYMDAKERLIQDQKGNWWVNQAKTKVVGEKPLRGLVGSDPYPRNLSLNRDELNGVLSNAADMWSAQGGGTPLERQTHLIQTLDDYLKTEKQVTLSVLQPNEKGYLPSAAFDFINNIQPGIKETSLYVKPAKVNFDNRPLINRKTSRTGEVRDTPIIDPVYEEMEAVPLPGSTKISGAGGVSAQDVDTETYEGPVTFFSERGEMAPQRLLPGAGRPEPGEQGSVLSRPYLETQPVGYRVKSPGSFARTQNPYTGAAAAAMGPASRVDLGNYQYTPQQLRVNLEPQSSSQLNERNLFALTANLTPGGRVSRGALQLGTGMGAIPAGLGNLSESQTVTRYGASGSQLQEVGNRLMAQAAYKRGLQPGPTSATSPPQQGPSTPPMQAPAPASSERQAPTSTEMAGYARRNAPIPEAIDPVQARNDAVARHIGNYISAASQRMEGPASIQGVKLKGVGQNSLRPYQTPSEGMIQQLMRAALRR
jgi:hypothetical protein